MGLYLSTVSVFQLNPSPVFTTGVLIGSVLPDIDHPHAMINQRLLIIHQRWAKAVVYTALGLFCAYQLSAKAFGYIPMGIFLILAGVSRHRGFTHHPVGILFFAASAYLLAMETNQIYLAFGAIMGYVMHCAGDQLKTKFLS